MKKILEYFGFDNEEKLGSCDVNPRAELNKHLNYPESLTKYINYISYSSDTEVYSLKDKTSGFIIEIYPSVGISDSLIRDLEYFFSDELPNNTFMQFTLIASHQTEKIMNDWNSIRTSQSSILKKIAKKRTEFLNNCAIKFETDSVTPRDYRLIVSVSQKGDTDKLINFKNKVFLKLKTLELLPSNVLPESFISLVSSIITPDFDKQNQISDYDDRKLLKNQCLNFGKTEIKEDLVSFNDTATKVYNVRSYPKEFSLSQMINLLGDSNKESSIPARFVLSLTIASVSESNKNNLIARGTSLIAAAEKGHFKYPKRYMYFDYVVGCQNNA